jgi:hypothetical protein
MEAAISLKTRYIFTGQHGAAYQRTVTFIGSPVLLNGRETWSLTLRERKRREEHRLRVHENRVLRKICESERNRVVGGWKNYNENLHNLYSLPFIISVIK